MHAYYLAVPTRVLIRAGYTRRTHIAGESAASMNINARGTEWSLFFWK